MQTQNSRPEAAEQSQGSDNHITIGLVRNARDPRITARSVPWAEFCDGLSRPEIRQQKDGTGIIFATFSAAYRAGKNVSAITAVGFDVDGKTHAPMHPAEAHDVLMALDWRHLIYTTWSHTPAEPRYRVIVALDGPLDPRALRDAQTAILEQLPSGVSDAVDSACLGDRARLFYAPACPPDRADQFEFYAGGDKPLRSATLLMAAAARQAVREQQQAQRKDVTARFTANGGHSVIREFNSRYTVTEILESAGYVKKRNRWVSPNSKSGTPGIVVLDNRVYCHHDADALHNGHALDAFGAYAAIHHGGDQKAAAAAVRGGAK
ncbi:hypothetical protein B1757_03840 [Acidithiobacillus marinus]|uniref:Uncharacterized protein n=1 Tax=Acidithiobacillus marinus TaxID=187490 RepID=A0A2I1DNW0_9PROT|nr:hypothetical protein [Acidithiobacillus marinus]PKY11546.1 hypothetical protein B1757_03840 [Acidithiobacillus marinus]